MKSTGHPKQDFTQHKLDRDHTPFILAHTQRTTAIGSTTMGTGGCGRCCGCVFIGEGSQEVKDHLIVDLEVGNPEVKYNELMEICKLSDQVETAL